jgi:hypothetical protein
VQEPFGRGFYEWWAGLDESYRYGVAIAILVASGLLWYFGVGGWMLAGPLFLVGVVLLLFAGDAK